MCGLTGFWQPRNFSADAAKMVATKMAARIIHRGPDDAGVWLDESAGIALAHRRLSILDLSPAGHQPMVSQNKRFVIAFNGEIYNHLDMRQALAKEGYAPDWRGHSDTETLLACFEAWGVEATLQKTVGMFAIALWDREERVLTLARDRIGEKPLYYGFQGDTFVFGSELKALKAHPDFMGEIDRDVICLYLRHSYIPAPYSIYKGIKKLPPATYLQLPLNRPIAELCAITPNVYWSLPEVVAQGVANPFVGSDAEAVIALEQQLKQSIGLQMIADVPLGAFLSGGVDSSTVVALMQAQSSRPVKTFSIGFEDQAYNEAQYAQEVARHLGTEHTELYVSPAEAMRVIPNLAGIYDEPFADSSQIPTFLVAQMARQHVTVSLSGDAGDELFCGYNRYALADKWRRIENFPFPLRKAAGRLISSITPSTWDALFRQIGKLKTSPSNMGEKLGKLASSLMAVDGGGELYYHIVSEVEQPEQIVIGVKEPMTWLKKTGIKSSLEDAKSHMMLMDAMTYLPDDILVKVDRAAMVNSLETRVPLLDHRVVEMAWKFPNSMKMRGNTSKWLLRQVLYQYVPKHLIERPKAGFAIPLGDWLRGPLRAWAETLLDEKRLLQEGFFNVQYVHEKWQMHLEGKRNNQSFLWSVLMFQIWLEEQGRVESRLC